MTLDDILAVLRRLRRRRPPWTTTRSACSSAARRGRDRIGVCLDCTPDAARAGRYRRASTWSSPTTP